LVRVDLVAFLAPAKERAVTILLTDRRRVRLAEELRVGKMVSMDTKRTLAEVVAVERVMVTQQKQAQLGHLDKVQQVVILASMKAVAAAVDLRLSVLITLMELAVMVAREHLGKVTQHLQVAVELEL
jgi:hypothetical protein